MTDTEQPSLFDFENEEIRTKFIDLVLATDGTEPCYDPYLIVEAGNEAILAESPTDLYVSPWASNSQVTKKTAMDLCAGCHALEQCRDYAVAAKEPYHIWGGTRPVDRGIVRPGSRKNERRT